MWPASVGNVRAAMSSTDVEQAILALVQNVSTVALLILDLQGHVLTWNKGAEALKGYRADEVLGRHFELFYPPEAVAVGHPQRELELAALTGRYAEEGWRVRKDGSRFWASVTIIALRDVDGDVRNFGKVTLDLTAERQKEEQVSNVLRLLDQTMRIDHLTGLPNRRGWDERLGGFIAAARSGRTLCVAMFDLDHFKEYNDELGHVAGDHLLKRAAVRWREALRGDDVLARYGGEEFVVAFPDCSPQDAEVVVRRMMALTPEGRTFSAGIAAWGDEQDGAAIIDRADRAMYDAKRAGRATVRLAPAHGDVNGS